MNTLLELDRALFVWVNGGSHPRLVDQFFLWLTHPPGQIYIFLALAVAIWARYRQRAIRPLLVLAVAVTLADRLGAEVLKPLVGRVRPCFALEDVHLLLTRQPHSPSFPSNHAANAFAAASALWPMLGRLRWGALVLAALIGISRVYVGVHFPSDVVFGALLGATIALGVRKGVDRIWPRRASAPTRRPRSAPPHDLPHDAAPIA